MVTKLLTAHYMLGSLVARNKDSGCEGGFVKRQAAWWALGTGRPQGSLLFSACSVCLFLFSDWLPLLTFHFCFLTTSACICPPLPLVLTLPLVGSHWHFWRECSNKLIQAFQIHIRTTSDPHGWPLAVGSCVQHLWFNELSVGPTKCECLEERTQQKKGWGGEWPAFWGLLSYYRTKSLVFLPLFALE